MISLTNLHHRMIENDDLENTQKDEILLPKRIIRGHHCHLLSSKILVDFLI